MILMCAMLAFAHLVYKMSAAVGRTYDDSRMTKRADHSRLTRQGALDVRGGDDSLVVQ